MGPEGEKYSIKALVDNVEKAIARKPDGIAVTITNTDITNPDIKRFDELLRRAINENIPIIAINVPDFRPNEERIPYKFYIGMDEYVCGERLAEAMLKFTPKRAVIVFHEKGHIGLENRAKGIKNVLGKVPTDEIFIGTDSSSAVEIFKDHFAKYEDTDTIFTLGPLGTDPALSFLEERKLVDKVKLATVDFLPDYIGAIKEGKIVCAADQKPFLQGFLPIQSFLYCEDLNISEDIHLGPLIVDKYNIDGVILVEGILEKLIERLGEDAKKKLKKFHLEDLRGIVREHSDIMSIIIGIIGIIVPFL